MRYSLLHIMSPHTPGADSQAELICQGGADLTCHKLVIGDRKSFADFDLPATGERQTNESILAETGAPSADATQAQTLERQSLRLRGTLDVAGYRRLRMLLREAEPNVIHLWDPQYLPAPALAALTRSRAWKLVATYRHPPGIGGRGRFAAQLLRSHANESVADSEFVRGACVAGGWADSTMSVISAGCESPTQSGETASSAGIDPGTRRIAAIGPITAHKRLGDLIWAIDVLAPLESKLQLAVVGSGAAKDQVRDACRTVRREERVSFHPRESLTDVLQTAELVAIPGDQDGCCHGGLQAMASGLPLVVARGGGNGELVGDEIAGLTFPAGDRGELARTLWRMLDEPELRERMGSAARQRVKERYSAEKLACAYADLYRGLLDN